MFIQAMKALGMRMQEATYCQPTPRAGHRVPSTKIGPILPSEKEVECTPEQSGLDV